MNQKPLKICVLAAASSSHTYLQCGILRDFGHHVTLVSPDDGKCPDGVRHVPCSVTSHQGIIGKLRWLKTIYNGVKSVEADVYHAHYAAELTTWMAWFVGKKPFMISCLGGDVLFDEQGTLGPIGRWITKRALKKCDHVTVVSNHLGKAVEKFGVHQSKIQRVIWGVNHEIFRPLSQNKTARSLWGVTEDAQVIFSPRMLKPFYNQIMMLDALKEVVLQSPKSVLVFATYNQDADYRKELEARTKELELEDHVRYAPPMNQQEMMLAYNGADLVISLSPSDGTPVSVMEAMACGTPVIMADLERYKEFFVHKETGWFTKIEASHVVSAILELLNDQPRYETLKIKGMTLIKEKADLHSQSRLLEESSYRLIDINSDLL
ncbi:glycosyltransferase family 4 protein [Kiloniella antarctica]|uniref:Glycosyltransferase family 4 protein n=1 Tax=Kiloniella antarctica TaxID=1550907 RepID=A0ABW5BPL8_9PROT